MNDLRQAAKQALEEFELFFNTYPHMEKGYTLDARKALRQALAEPEHEPVAWGIANTRPTEKNPLMMVMLYEPKPSHLVIPLYTAPPKREWVGLTEKDRDDLEDYCEMIIGKAAFDAIESKLKEKNE